MKRLYRCYPGLTFSKKTVKHIASDAKLDHHTCFAGDKSQTTTLGYGVFSGCF